MVAEYDIVLVYGGNNCIQPGSASLSMVVLTGVRVVNFADYAFKYSEVPIVNSDGASPLMDGNYMPTNLILEGQMYGGANYPASLLSLEAYIGSQIYQYNLSKTGHLKLTLLGSSGNEVFRLYSRVQQVTAPRVRKTRHNVQDRLQISMRRYDPAIYKNTSQTKVCAVSGGSYSGSLSNSGNLATKRLTIKILKNGASNPTNVTVTLAGETLLVSDTLTTLNDYWFIDCFEGWIRKNSESRDGTTDLIDKFSGRFPDCDSGSNSIIISDTASSSFQVSFEWLPRYM